MENKYLWRNPKVKTFKIIRPVTTWTWERIMENADDGNRRNVNVEEDCRENKI